MIKNFMLMFMGSNRYSCPILMKLEFSGVDFRKILKYLISLKTLSVGADLFCVGGQT
jgi:hypothetical protein